MQYSNNSNRYSVKMQSPIEMLGVHHTQFRDHLFWLIVYLSGRLRIYIRDT